MYISLCQLLLQAKYLFVLMKRNDDCSSNPSPGLGDPRDFVLLVASELTFWLSFPPSHPLGVSLLCGYCSVTKLCPTLCDPMDCNIPGFLVLYSDSRPLSQLIGLFSRPGEVVLCPVCPVTSHSPEKDLPSPNCSSLERLMLKLKLQYFGHLMLRTDSLEKNLMLGKTEGKKTRGQQRMSWLDSITDSMDMNLSKL